MTLKALEPTAGIGYAVAVVATVLAGLVRWALDPILGATVQYLLFGFSVVLAALVGGTGPGILAVGLGAAAGACLFTALGHAGSGPAGSIARLGLFVAFGVAITLAERWSRNSRAALRQSEERAMQAARLAEENPYPVLSIAADHRVRYANQAAQRFLAEQGWQPGSAAPAGLGALAAAALRTGQATETSLEGGGSTYAFSCVPIAPGRYVNVYGRDATAARRTEGALREREAQLRRSNAELEGERARWQGVVEGIADEVWACDAEGRMSLVNLATVTAMGLEEFKGKTVDAVLEDVDILNPDGRPRAPEQAPLLRSLRGEIVRGEEIMRHRRTGRTRYRQFSSAPIRDAAGAITGAVAIVRDITEYKQASEEILRLNEALLKDASELQAAKIAAEQAKAVAEEANRAKDHFLAVLSHELRTPLTPVLAGVSLIETDRALSTHTRRYLEVLRRNVKLECRLIDDLLDLTRITRGKIELDRRPIELCTVINGAVEVCRPDIESRGLHFGIDWGPRPYPVEADAARLQQAFWNLIQNAAKFTPRGGCVGMICRREDGHVVVEVNDSGIGIEPEAIGRIFEAFQQADRLITPKVGGLGLGLTISRALIEMHGGTIEAHSDGQGRGATFRVRLPLAVAGTGEVSEGDVRAARPPAARYRTLKILLVEDHSDTSAMIGSALRLAGHQVETAADVVTALDMASQEPFDVLVSDLGLPDGSGLDLMRRLRLDGITLPGIAVTGYGREYDIEQSRAAGFEAHLVKPVEPEQLLQTLEQVTTRGFA